MVSKVVIRLALSLAAVSLSTAWAGHAAARSRPSLYRATSSATLGAPPNSCGKAASSCVGLVGRERRSAVVMRKSASYLDSVSGGGTGQNIGWKKRVAQSLGYLVTAGACLTKVPQIKRCIDGRKRGRGRALSRKTQCIAHYMCLEPILAIAP